MEELARLIADALNLPHEVVSRLLATVTILLVLWILRRIVLSFVHRRVTEGKARYNWRKGTAYVIYGLGIFLVFRVWFEGMGPLATYLGLLSAGLAVALKDPIANIAG